MKCAVILLGCAPLLVGWPVAAKSLCDDSGNARSGVQIFPRTSIDISAKFFSPASAIASLRAGIAPSKFSLFSNVDIQRTVDPVLPQGDLIVGTRPGTRAERNSDLKGCVAATKRFREASRDRADSPDLSADFACALIYLERNCLTATEVPPMVDLTIAKAAVVTLHSSEGDLCMGLLESETSMITSRHCFVSPLDGKLYTRPLIANGQTLDGKRSVAVKLPSPNGPGSIGPYELDRDGIRVPVLVTKVSGVPDLPIVNFERVSEVSGVETAAWLAGNVYELQEAKILEATTRGDPPPRANWFDQVRWGQWLGAQCRTRTVDGTCVYHSCQSLRGFSGSPIITRTQGGNSPRLVYSGVHSGTPGALPKGWGYCSSHGDKKKADRYKDFNLGDLEIEK